MRHSEKQAKEQVSSALQHDNRLHRRFAVSIRGRHYQALTTQAVLSALDDPEAAVRARAASILDVAEVNAFEEAARQVGEQAQGSEQPVRVKEMLDQARRIASEADQS
ncbi:MAG: hypothetical protein JO250_14635 [Armatimonadetes bacterium]|nr:hypothetical protein [Armatimonadota bacterium]